MLSRRFKPAHLAVTALAMTISACSLLPENSAGPDIDKTYQLTELHTNDNHGRFWQDGKNQYGMAARMTLIEQIREEVAKTVVMYFCCPAVISIPAFLSLICRMRCRISRG